MTAAKIRRTRSSARPEVAYLTAIKTVGAASLTMNVATGWSTTPDFIIYRKDASGALVPGTVTTWNGDLSGTTISNLSLKAGTDQEYAAGELTVVEAVPTAAWSDDLVQALLLEHKVSGAHDVVTATSVTTTGNIETTAGAVKTDTISEHTSAAGVTIDGLLLKDGKLATNDSVVTANVTDAAVTPNKWRNPYCFGVTNNVARSVPATSLTKMLFSTEVWDNNNEFASSRYTCTLAGVYHFDAAVDSAAGSELFQVSFFKNGVQHRGGPYTDLNGVGSSVAGHTLSMISADIVLAVNDYVEVYVYSDDAISTSSDAVSNYFNGHLISAV